MRGTSLRCRHADLRQSHAYSASASEDHHVANRERPEECHPGADPPSDVTECYPVQEQYNAVNLQGRSRIRLEETTQHCPVSPPMMLSSRRRQR